MYKTLILGHSRGGKDQFADFLGVSYESSSRAALEIFLFRNLNEWRDSQGLPPYKDKESAYSERHKYRDVWHKLIAEYNSKDGSRLARGILNRNDCYVGMRSDFEFRECQKANMFDYIFWVDGTSRTGVEEDNSSFNITFDPTSMLWVDNNGTLDQLKSTADFYNRLFDIGSGKRRIV